jgi:pimeloyl-ACP methyl ester carboxylesterase
MKEPYVNSSVPEWEDMAEAQGVRLRSSGTGRPLIILPGMEGDGTSCLHVVTPVVQRLRKNKPIRMILVDYSAEKHRTLSDLDRTVVDLLRVVVDEPAYVWGQSFGCLLAAVAAHNLPTQQVILVSPFTRLPRSREVVTRLIRWTPRFLYRVTSKPLCRWVFGPVGSASNHPFFAALQNADPRDVARRSAWLRGEDHADRFTVIASLTSAWFGARDRLINLPQQMEIFGGMPLGKRIPRTVAGAGHVILPTESVDILVNEISSIFDEPL